MVADANTINFAAGVTGQIILGAPRLLITNPLTINGPGARSLNIDTGVNTPGFRVNTAGDVMLSGLYLSGGSYASAGGNGAAVNHSGGGTLTLVECRVAFNIANGDLGGGALFNDSGNTLVLSRCTFHNNFTNRAGGAIYNLGALTATNCTFSTNTALNGGSIISKANFGNSSAALRNCTITDSIATDPNSGGGGVYAEGANAQFHLSNTIIAGNSSAGANPDIRGNVTSDGHNFIGKVGFASGLTNGVNGDQVGSGAGINPNFAATLTNNGGPTDTRAIVSPSTAINAGDDALAPAADQRGFSRVGASDIGAFEANGVPPPVTLLSAVSRKTHGSAGAFDVPLPPAFPPAVESRTGGVNGDHTVIFTFSNPLASVGGAAVSSGAGSVGTSGIGSDPHQYVVNLTGVLNAQRITVTLSNVNDSLGYTSGAVAATMGLLLGDTSNDGFVNSGDAVQTRNRSGQAASAITFRSDYNLDGTINSGDAIVVRSRFGDFIP